MNGNNNEGGGGPTLHAAGTFRTGSCTPEGAKISLGAMLRLQVEPASGTFRISVRAVHGVVAAALRAVLAAQLAGGAAVGESAAGVGMAAGMVGRMGA